MQLGYYGGKVFSSMRWVTFQVKSWADRGLFGLFTQRKHTQGEVCDIVAEGIKS